jgi:hypothetical protein
MPRKKTPNIDFMISYVEDYLNGNMERWEFDIDFDYHIIERYSKMLREYRDFAEAFAFYISERGVDIGEGFSDADYKDLISRQYRELLDVAKEGFY